jgi:hypothetical protein
MIKKRCAINLQYLNFAFGNETENETTNENVDRRLF